MPTPPIRTLRHDVNDRPFIVVWEMTQACPLACVHCRAGARPDRDSDELTTDQASAMMRQVAEFGSPRPVFVLTRRLGAMSWSAFLLVPTGRGALLPALTAAQVEDVRTERLTDIYRTSPLFTGLRDGLRNHDRLSGRCGACEFAAACGGSRSRAFPYPDDLAEFGLQPISATK